MWLWAVLALALAGSVACSDDPPASAASPAVTATVPAAGSTAGQGGTSAAGAAAGAGAPAAGSGGTSAAAPDAGMADGGAGMPAVACRVPDDLPLIDADADGGLAPDCHDVPRTIITGNCIGWCHHNRPGPSGGLNLMSPCVADRLLDVRSRCEGLLLVDSAHPERSFILDKLESEKPRCGASMPDGYHLPPHQQACMNAWVHAIIRASR